MRSALRVADLAPSRIPLLGRVLRFATLALLAGTVTSADASPSGSTSAPPAESSRQQQNAASTNDFRSLLQKAQSGDADAQLQIGIMYGTGLSVSQDLVQAAMWYRRAADQGQAGAQFVLGDAYLFGHGVPRDPGQAVAWYRKAATQGHKMAQYNLGAMCLRGNGVPLDPAQAATWFRKAADQENAMAQFNMGVLCANGQGVPRDQAQAIGWYRRSAELGYPLAQSTVGVAYFKGDGVPLDYQEAFRWVSLAAARASGDEQKKYATARDAFANLMTPAQLAEAQKRARMDRGVREAEEVMEPGEWGRCTGVQRALRQPAERKASGDRSNASYRQASQAFQATRDSLDVVRRWSRAAGKADRYDAFLRRVAPAP